MRSAPITCYGRFEFRLYNQVWNKKPVIPQPLPSMSFSFAKTPMRTPIASYSLFFLSFVIFVKGSPLVNVPSSLVLNFANGNNTGPRLPSNTTDFTNDALDMSTVWAKSQPFIQRTTNPSAAFPRIHLLVPSSITSHIHTSVSNLPFIVRYHSIIRQQST